VSDDLRDLGGRFRDRGATVPATLQHLLDEHRESLRLAEEAEATYVRVQAQHREQGKKMGRTRVTSDIRASTDARLLKAASDDGYFLNRALVYGTAYLVERAAGKDRTWPTN